MILGLYLGGPYMRSILVFFCLVSVAHADEWTKADTYRQAAVTTLLVADWAQTRYIAKRPCENAGGGTQCQDPYLEKGLALPFIGEHPSVGRVNSYFIAGILGNYAISHTLPRDWRNAWQYFWIGDRKSTR